MIASLRGTLLEHAEGSCILECAGVGYLVHVSAHTFAELPPIGSPVRLRTRQIVREDALQLFGFVGDDEARLFDLLIGVSGVGPRLAIAALSGLQPSALARAIRDEHIAALVAVPGIGRKTAERLVVELRDKVGFLASPASTDRSGPGVLPRSERWDDAVTALVQLGYGPAQAQDTLRQLGAEAETLELEELVRRALARLARPAALTR